MSAANESKIQRIITDLRTIPEMTAVVSGYTLRQLARFSEAPRADALGRTFFSADDRATRVTLRLKNLGGRPFTEIKNDIAGLWAAADTAGLSYDLTGIIPLILEAQDHLLTVQSLMLPVVVGVICVILFIVFRSPRLLGLAVVANFIPLIITAGALSWLSIPLNSINLFVSSVMIGVIVDDTIHLLHAYQTTGTMELALEEVGTALWITSVIVCVGFASLLVSHLVPIHQFGVLSIIAVGSAWLCDVCLLPTLAGARR